MLAIVQNNGGTYTGITPKDTVGTLRQRVGSPDELTYTVYPESPAYGQAIERATQVLGLDKGINEEVFRGRVSSISGKSSGSTSQTVTCESAEARLKDSIISLTTVINENIKAALARMLEAHNAITDSDSQVVLGECPDIIITEPHEFDYVSAYEAISTTLNDLGYEWRVRYSDAAGEYYLDAAAVFGEVSTTAIRIGQNLGSIKYSSQPGSIATRLIPLGGVGYNGKRLDISITQPGMSRIYLDRADLIAKYGVICRRVLHEELIAENEAERPAKAATLLALGEQDIAALGEPAVTWEITAVDLARAGYAADTFRAGWFYRVTHPILGVDVVLRLIEIYIDYRAPQRTRLTFGDSAVTASGAIAGASANVSRAVNTASINAVSVINAKTGGVTVKPLAESAYTSLSIKDPYTLYIATTDNDFTLYFGSLSLRSGGGSPTAISAAAVASSAPPGFAADAAEVQEEQ